MFGSRFDFKKLALQLVTVNTSSAIIAIVFTASNTSLGNALSAETVATSFVYGNCIGTLICLAIWFLNNFWNRGSAIFRLAKVSMAIFIATFFGVATARIILSWFFPAFIAKGIIPGWQNFVFSLGMGFTFGFAYYFYGLSQSKLIDTEMELRQTELAEEQAKALAIEAQLASLESKIHPHFLFNTLNSIAALIREDPSLAEKMVEKLSALLRYSLDSNAASLVSLKQELEITEKYLEIEKVRFDKRLQYKIESNEKYEHVKLPPLALQTLVENSIKHVASKTSGKTEIVISAKENGVGLIIEVRDNGAGFNQSSIREGHGLDILQKRLAAIFQKNANLEITENGAVRLKIPK